MADLKPARLVSKSCAHLSEPGDLTVGGNLAGFQFSSIEVVCSVSDFVSPTFIRWISTTVLSRTLGAVTVTITQ